MCVAFSFGVCDDSHPAMYVHIFLFCSMGAITSAKQAFRRYLQTYSSDNEEEGDADGNDEKGRAMIVVVGGASESLMAEQGSINLVGMMNGVALSMSLQRASKMFCLCNAPSHHFSHTLIHCSGIAQSPRICPRGHHGRCPFGASVGIWRNQSLSFILDRSEVFCSKNATLYQENIWIR